MFCDFNFKYFFSILILFNLNHSNLCQQLKKTCTNPNGTPGNCVSIYYCDSLKNTIQREPLTEKDKSFLLQSQCTNGVGPLPYVCCTKDEEFIKNEKTDETIMPISTSTALPLPNENVIQEQNRNQDGTKLPQIPNCGVSILDQRIYNGKDATLGEFPWMVLLEYKRKNGQMVQDCAGSLINSRYILTAAHCLTGQILSKVGSLQSVRLGEHDLSRDIDCELPNSNTNCADPIVHMDIDEIIPHEEYDDGSVNRYHDIGLIRLKEHVNYTNYINAVCLPSISGFQRSLPGEHTVVSGWGRTTSAAKSEIKQKLQVPVVSHDDCRKKFATQKVNLIDNQLCAGGIFYEDSCDGDSGGPLMKQSHINWILEGVVSFGYKCGLENWPAIYTRVSSYEDWIKSKLKP